jgi:L-aminopeptidase/D-esterase-like protein
MRRGVVRRSYHAENTTLAVVVTNARLGKVQATKLAQIAHQGMIRTVSPVHTTLDGDLVISLATGEREVDLNALGLAAADAVADAILRAVRTATSLGGLPAWKDLQGS